MLDGQVAQYLDLIKAANSATDKGGKSLQTHHSLNSPPIFAMTRLISIHTRHVQHRTSVHRRDAQHGLSGTKVLDAPIQYHEIVQVGRAYEVLFAA